MNACRQSGSYEVFISGSHFPSMLRKIVLIVAIMNQMRIFEQEINGVGKFPGCAFLCGLESTNNTSVGVCFRKDACLSGVSGLRCFLRPEGNMPFFSLPPTSIASDDEIKINDYR